jgi:hypothetical protein
MWYIFHMVFLAFQFFQPCIYLSSCFSFLYPIAVILIEAPYSCTVVHVIHFLQTLSLSLIFIPILLYLTLLWYFGWKSFCLQKIQFFFGTCDTFPTWYFYPLHSSHPSVIHLHTFWLPNFQLFFFSCDTFPTWCF